MKVILSTPAIWVDDQTTFDQVMRQMLGSARVGVDTESNSLHAYHERVCLIQFTDQRADYLIDPFADINLSSLSDLFASEKIEKIFHAAEYDIMCLKRDFSFEFTNLFDTMQASRILGIEKIGLSNLLLEQFGVDQGKSFQKANWGKRPLPLDLREYARLDTHFLPQLRDLLAQRLEQKGLLELAQEDFHRLSQVQPAHRDTPLYAQVSGYHLLDERSLAILDELANFRDGMAKRLDRPLFKIIGNSALVAIARQQPIDAKELREVEGVSPRIIERYEKELVEAVRKGRSAPPIKLQKHRRPSQAYQERLQALQNWRRDKGKEMGVQSDIILPRDILENIAGAHPQVLPALQSLMQEIPWRFKHFGHDIIKVVNKGKSA